MSVTLQEAKNYLRVIGDDHDTTIQEMLNRAFKMAGDYIDADLETLTSSSSDGLSEGIQMGILTLVEMQWSTPPEKREAMKQLAHEVMHSSRTWLAQ